jgi:RHS repeat-associated protein
MRETLVRVACAAALILAVTPGASAQSLPASCTFTDDPVAAGVTAVKAAHVSQLRACINDIRAQRSLPAASWTDPTLTPQQSVIKAVHITELRSAISQVYTALNVSPPQFTDTLTPLVTVAKAVHINELRTAARNAPSPFCGSGTPTISSLNPTWGPVGTTVTVSGTNFGAAQCGSTLWFNGTPASPSQWSATSITAAVPTGATTGYVTVTVGSITSNGVLFTVGLNPPTTPTISSISPLSGAVGTVFTITGSNLWGTVGSSTVLFDNSTFFSAPILTSSPTSITAAVPMTMGEGVHTITVRAGTDTSNGWPFTVETTPPVGDPGGSVEYYHQDAIGSIRLITNAAGAETKRFDYLPFGQEWTTTSSHPNTLRFTGKERDRQTEYGPWTALDYFGARHYQGQTGRFTSSDSVLNADQALADPQRWNRYTYGLNNPFRNIDPDGKEPVKAQAGTIARFVSEMNASPSAVGAQVGAQAMGTLGRLGETSGLEPSVVRYFNKSANRYVFTELGGWIDMVHFLFYAGRAMQNSMNGVSNPMSEAVQDGFLQERVDSLPLKAPWSAYSYEDLPSDRFGALFATQVFDPNNKATLGQQIEGYLNALGATDPRNAPNWQKLPMRDSRNPPIATNPTTSPMFTR